MAYKDAKKSTMSNRQLKVTKESKKTKFNKLVGEDDKDIKPDFYVCCTCGKHYKELDKNFPCSQSDLYAGLDYHLPICRRCIDKLFNHYIQVYGGNEDKAIERICKGFDIYFDESLLNASRKINKSTSRIGSYIAKSNLVQYRDRTYDTTLDKEKNERIDSEAELENNENIEDIEQIKKDIDTWGLGYSEDEYKILNKHYFLLTQKLESVDYVQETLIRDLCDIKVMQNRAKARDDSDKFEKYIKLYQSTLSSAKLKPETNSLDENNDTFGCWIRDIENTCPAEYYSDKSKFKDFFNIGEYCERFIFRPLKNLFLGTKEKDDEFNIDDDKFNKVGG